MFSPKFSLVNRTSSRVVSIYMGSAVAVSGIHAVGPGIPELQKHFGVSENQALWSLSFYLFPGMIAAIPLGRLADRVGRRHLYAVCLAVFGFMSLLVPLAGYSWPLFLGIRLVCRSTSSRHSASDTGRHIGCSGLACPLPDRGYNYSSCNSPIDRDARCQRS